MFLRPLVQGVMVESTGINIFDNEWLGLIQGLPLGTG